ncbi:MAG: hypothetical protein OXF41_16035 [bacterium]|nr:hypothetical protein [bacterium]
MAGTDIVIPQAGTAMSGPYEVRVDPVVDDEHGDIRALRIRLVRTITEAETEEHWTTTTHWLMDGHSGWIWIDLEWISDDISQQRSVYPPGIVQRLLKNRSLYLDRDNRGPNPVTVSNEQDINDLFDRLFDSNRTVPLVLYSFDRHLSHQAFEIRIQNAARRLAGCADVRALNEPAQGSFHDQIDQIGMSVYGGAVRIYLPILDKYDPEPWKHRYIQSRYLPRDPQQAAGRIARHILPRMIAQSPPAVYQNRIRKLLSGINRDWQETAFEQDTRIRELEDLINRLRSDVSDLNLYRDLAIEEAIESEIVAESARLKLDQLRAYVRLLGKTPEVIEQQVDEHVVASSCREAIQTAQQLDLIVIHPDAPQDIERLDQDEDSRLWAAKISRCLRSLNTYANHKRNGDFEGNFKTWCDNSGHDDRLNSRKFVALRESETVRKNRLLMSKRHFPIAQSISASGRIAMESHLKVVEGGGMNIPRIYFHDDTRRTGKVYVGFIGPHDLVPNKSKN